MTHVPPPPGGPQSTPIYSHATQPPHASPARSSGKLVSILLAIIVGLAVGFGVRGLWPPQDPPSPSAFDPDCERILLAQSVSQLENGDVVALLQELETDDDVIGHIREHDTDFRFGPEDLYCLGKAGIPLEVLREMLEPAPAPVEVAETKPLPRAPKETKPSGILLASGTPIVLRLEKEVHTKTISVGQSVPLKVAEPIQVQGVTLVTKGTPVYAEVVKARKGRIMGKGAELSLKVTTVRAVDGQMIRLDALRHWYANSKTEAVNFADGVDADARQKYDAEDEVVKFSPGVFIKGKNIVLPAGTHLTIYNPRPCHIRA